jgi:threonine dehydratase
MTPPFVGALPLAIVLRLGVELAVVTEDEIAATMRELASRAKLVAEGSGAAATAALLAGRIMVRPGSTVVTIVSGGNVDPDRLSAVLGS